MLKQTKVSLGRVRDLEWSYFREMDLISLGSSFLKIEKILSVSAIHRNRDDPKGLTKLCKHSTLSQEKNYPGNFAPNRNCLRQFFPIFLAVIFSSYTSAGGTEAMRATRRSEGSDNSQERVRLMERRKVKTRGRPDGDTGRKNISIQGISHIKALATQSRITKVCYTMSVLNNNNVKFPYNAQSCLNIVSKEAFVLHIENA